MSGPRLRFEECECTLPPTAIALIKRCQQRAKLFRRALAARFEAVEIATKPFEDYHRSALSLRLRPSVLYELRLRHPQSEPQ